MLLLLIVDAKGWMGQTSNNNKNHQVPYKAAATTTTATSNIDRRSVLGKMIVSLTTAGGGGIFAAQPAFGQPPLNLPVLQEGSDNSSSTTTKATTSIKSATTTTPTFDAYYITPDETNVRSKLDKISSEKFIKQIASSTSSSRKGGAIWLGEHHNSLADHDFQATFIQEIYKKRQQHKQQSSKSNPANMAIGLEQVQQEFQPVLDAYIDGKISLDRMRFMVQWDKRWMWSFDNYSKIFETAKELNIPLLALNVDSEDLSLVEKQGYPGLPKDRLRKYIKDP